MRTILFCISCIALCLSGQSQEWEDAASLPSSASKHHPVTFAINGIGYSITGSNAFDNSTNTAHKYDPIADSWTAMSDFPGPGRSFSYGVTDGEFGYMGFGLSTQTFDYFNDLWRFDPSDESWEQLTSCPCEGRRHPAFIHVDGKIFVGAGDGPISGNLKDWWEYDIASDNWIAHTDIPGVPRHHPYYFDLDGYAFVGFGHGNGIFRDLYRWDPSDDSWTQMNDFPGEARVAGTQFSHDGFGYVLSGDGDDHFYMEEGEFWQYDPSDDSWLQMPSHPGLSRWAPGSFVIDGVVYLVQGQERFLNQFPAVANTNSVLKFDLDGYLTFLGTEELNSQEKLKLFPNPTSDKLNLISETSLVGRIQLFNFIGEEVELEFLQENVLDVSALPTGVYFIAVQSGSSSQTYKFIKD